MAPIFQTLEIPSLTSPYPSQDIFCILLLTRCSGFLLEVCMDTFLVHSPFVFDHLDLTPAGPGESSVGSFGSLLSTLATNYGADVYAMDLRGVSGVDVCLHTNIFIPFLSSYLIKALPSNFWDSLEPQALDNIFKQLSDNQKAMLPYLTTDNNCRDLYNTIMEIDRAKKQVRIPSQNRTYEFTQHAK